MISLSLQRNMDPRFFWNFTALALLLPIILFFLKNRKNKRPISVKWPPGPKTLPIIGNMHQISALPFRCLTDLAKLYGPLMRLKLGEVETIVVSSPEIAREMLKEQDPCYADRPGAIGMKILWYDYRDVAFSPYGEYWKQMRRICVTEMLSPASVRSFDSIRRDEVSRLVESIRLSAGKPVNLSQKIFSMMSSITSRAVFGKVMKDKDALIKIIRHGVRSAGGFQLADFFPSSWVINSLNFTKLRLLMMRRRVDAALDDLIEQHRVHMVRENEEGESGRRGNGEFGNEDLVDVLLRVQETGELQFPLGNENIKAVIFDMFGGGTDTSSTAIEWAMVELMRHPRVMAKAQAEVRGAYDDNTIGSKGGNDQKLKYLKMVIKETLRLHPPVPMLPRASREEREINGYKIPAKAKVLVNNWAMQRDPKYWTNPESFEPERFEECSKEFLGADFDYLPFGTGKRMCPGIIFALAGDELVLAQLLYHFQWKLPTGVEPESMDMIENPGIAASRKENLYVVATPYN